MDVTLVTTSFNDTVHGTFNGKFTGCKINLQKSENATKFRRTHLMTDLGEITCEKCKARIAKEMIKADQKEMKVLLKEEKLRAKRGIEDEGIVPLGNTTAKITGNQRHDDRRDRRDYGGGTEYRGSSASNSSNYGGGSEYKGSSNNYGGGTEYTGSSNNYGGGTEYTGSSNNYGGGTEYTGSSNNYGGGTEYKGNSYNEPAQEERPRPAQKPAEEKPMDEFSAFIAAQPKPRNPQPQPQAQPQTPLDDPFAVPAPAPAAAPADDDDYLAQFAIPKPAAPVPQAAAPQDDFLAQFAIPAPAPAQPEPAPQPQVQQPAPAVNSGDDIMNMFSIGAKPSSELDIFSNNSAPAAPSAYNNSDVIDVAADALTPAGAPAEAEPGNSGNSEWDRLANQLFGFGGQEAPQAAPAQPAAPAAPAPMGMDDLSFPAPGQTAAPIQPAAAPALDDISAPILADISSAADEIVVPEAVSDDYNTGLSDEDFMEEDVDDSELLDTDDDTAAIEDIVSAAAAQVRPQPAAPVIPQAPVTPKAPVAPKAPAQPAAVQPGTPVMPAGAVPPAGAAQPIVTVPQFAGYDAANQPIYTYIQMQLTGYDQNGQPIYAPMPGQQMPIPPAAPAYSGMQSTIGATSLGTGQNAALINQILNEPTDPSNLTIGQKIAAANANVADVQNVSKIAVHQHNKGASQTFISAISGAKAYANQSLTDTQGLQQHTRVLGSVEDVLAAMGDTSYKQKQAEAAARQQGPAGGANFHVDEYKPSSRRPVQASSRPPMRTVEDERFLTKSELKAKKKQDKIDAKFKKDMAKRGL
ncbi:MAG: hypothetical protein J5501_06440 [Ruminococcus sp.]|nr:hypothetical protein [Ruminococcus sp.]